MAQPSASVWRGARCFSRVAQRPGQYAEASQADGVLGDPAAFLPRPLGGPGRGRTRSLPGTEDITRSRDGANPSRLLQTSKDHPTSAPRDSGRRLRAAREAG